jgi:hypothetical protein
MRLTPSVPRRPLWSLLAGVSLLIGCSNSSTGPNASGHYVRFNANGTQVSFTIDASLQAAFAHAGNAYDATLTGSDLNGSISLTVLDVVAITTKQYAGYQISGGGLVGVLIVYQQSGAGYRSVTTSASDAVITITDITATEVKGTFSGTLKRNGQPDIVVTNGEFSVHRAN